MVTLLVPVDPVVGALIWELAEVLGHRVTVAGAEEAPAAALTRREPSVAFVDADHTVADDEAFYATARRSGTAVILYSDSRTAAELHRLAATHGAATFPVPNGPRLLERTISEAQLLAEHAECTKRADEGIACAGTGAVQRVVESTVDNLAGRVARWARVVAQYESAVARHETLIHRAWTAVSESRTGRLARQVAAAQREAAREARARLREEVRGYARLLKAQEVPAQRAAAVVKAVVRDALEAPPLGDPAALSADAETWCLEAYSSAA
jgi:hypothetical protein